MPLIKIYANLSCSELNVSIPWYETLFDRSPDARPMTGLAEWHHAELSGFQRYENADNAGSGTPTFIVDDLAGEKLRGC